MNPDIGLKSDAPITVMQTPLVMTFADANLNPIDMDVSVLDKILNGKHSSGITPDIMKRIPRSLTEPLMIFKRKSDGRVVVVLELTDTIGGNIVIPFELDVSRKRTRITNVITSMYGKSNDSMTHPVFDWYDKWMKSSDYEVRYLDNKKTTAWAGQHGIQFPSAYSAVKRGLSDSTIKVETDLVKLRYINKTKTASWIRNGGILHVVPHIQAAISGSLDYNVADEIDLVKLKDENKTTYALSRSDDLKARLEKIFEDAEKRLSTK
jgi:hypothetical protein